MINYIRNLLQKIALLASSAWNFLTGVWNLLVNFKNTLETFISNGTSLILNCISEFEKIKNFEFDPKWNSRVISVPRAKENLDELIQIPSDILATCKEIMNILKQKLEPETFEFDPEDLKFVPEEFARFLTKVLGWVALVIDCFVSWNQAIIDANHIVDDIRNLRENIENFDSLFLQQGNPKIVTDVKYRKRQRT